MRSWQPGHEVDRTLRRVGPACGQHGRDGLRVVRLQRHAHVLVRQRHAKPRARILPRSRTAHPAASSRCSRRCDPLRLRRQRHQPQHAALRPRSANGQTVHPLRRPHRRPPCARRARGFRSPRLPLRTLRGTPRGRGQSRRWSGCRSTRGRRYRGTGGGDIARRRPLLRTWSPGRPMHPRCIRTGRCPSPRATCPHMLLTTMLLLRRSRKGRYLSSKRCAI
jgi:hypothetical protein